MVGQRKNKVTEQPVIGRTGSRLECIDKGERHYMGNRHYWEKIVFLPGEPCNCGSYAYQPDEPSGYSEVVKEKNKIVDATKEEARMNTKKFIVYCSILIVSIALLSLAFVFGEVLYIFAAGCWSAVILQIIIMDIFNSRSKDVSKG